MGERGADHEEDPTPDEIAEMSRLVKEALLAGALGFATSRTFNHRTRLGRNIGTLTATEEELLGIGDALRETGRGVFQFVSDFRDPEFELGLMKRLAKECGRPLSVALAQADPVPERWREVLGYLEAAQAEGVDMKAQIAARPIGIIVGLEGTVSPFMATATYQAIAGLPLAERVARMRQPEVRARILAEYEQTGKFQYSNITRALNKTFRLGNPPDYEPDPSASFAAEAERRGVPAAELVYDAILEDDGHQLLYVTLVNYSNFNLDHAREMVLSDRTLFGLSDGGAHVGLISDASFPTSNLTLWCRDRVRGEQLPLELVVKGQTRDTARHVGWYDRGVLAPGYRADINVIDFESLRLHRPEMHYDLPAGGKRLMQRVDGYRYTVKAGTVTFEDGEHTGELPGRLVRGAQAAPR